MEPALLRSTCRRVLSSCNYSVKRRPYLPSRRSYTTSQDTPPQDEIQAAPPINFSSDSNQLSRPRAELIPQSIFTQRGGDDKNRIDYRSLLSRARIVPASPSYFSATPQYTDDYLYLSALLRRHQILPTLPAGEAPRVSWKKLDQYKTEVAEPVRQKKYGMLLALLKRLNLIHPSLMPEDVQVALEKYKRDVQPHLNKPKPIVVDSYGVARANGRRKSSSANVHLVEGDGQVLINERSLTDYFPRLHDRESAVWALKATGRLDKYNVWVLVSGGGMTGQSEAITLALSKALLAHEPDLKPALRRGMCLCRRLFRYWMSANRSTLQLGVSLAIQGVWRGKSLVTLKRERCQHGLNGDIRCNFFLTVIKFHAVRVFRHSSPIVPTGLSMSRNSLSISIR